MVKNERGFMGFTHALSAVAVVAVVLAFAPGVISDSIGFESIPLVVLIFFAVSGGALWNDLDNTNSTAHSSLGILGSAMSVILRSSSVFLQTTLRTRRDDKDPNPHRGAWHAPIFCLIPAIGVYALTQLPGRVDIPFIGTLSYGRLSALLVVILLTHMSLAALFNKSIKKIRNSVGGDIFAFALSFFLVFFLWHLLPADASLTWVPFAFYAGMFVHIVGDGFTTSGTPLLAPIPYKGKIWYNFRIPPHIKAGGEIEKLIFVPLFSFIIIASALKIFYDFYLV